MMLGPEASNALRTVGSGGAVVYLATSSADGNPNIVGERFVTLYKGEFILIAEMFAQKTRVNLNENAHGVITLAHPVKGRTWSFAGPATILQEGHEPGATWEGLDVAETLAEWGDWATKAEAIKQIQDKSIKFKKGEISDVKVMSFDPNIAVAHYNFTYDATFNGTHRARTVICSDTWISQSGAWKLASDHVPVLATFDV